MQRLWIRVWTLVALLLSAACSVEPPFARINPMDRGSNYEVTVHGPDSIHALGERFTLTLTTAPALPDDDYELVWEASPHIECLPKGADQCGYVPTQVASVAGEGVFEVIDIRAEYRTIAVSVYFGAKPFSHFVTIGQKAVTMDLSCAPTAFVPCDDTPFLMEQTISIYPRMTDARGHPIVKKIGYALERGSVVSRDLGVVAPLPIMIDDDNSIRLHARHGGATWVVVEVDGVVDSIRVAVQPP